VRRLLTPIAANPNVKPDPEIAKLVDERRAETAKYTSRVVGRTDVSRSSTRARRRALGI
jgi:2',3'-cyclic-nucleotide 2'-phosphodiesterase (5'-nucleotidase family)